MELSAKDIKDLEAAFNGELGLLALQDLVKKVEYTLSHLKCKMVQQVMDELGVGQRDVERIVLRQMVE